MNKKDTSCALYLIQLIRSAVNGENAPLPQNYIDWSHLFQLADDHSVANIAYYALCESDIEVDPSVLSEFKEARNKAVVREAKQELEKEQLKDELEKRRLRFMFLKGSVIKNIYPRVDMRTMSDIDLIIDETKSGVVRHIMQNLGYKLFLDCDLHDIYHKKPIMNIEVHKRLIDECFEQVNEFFGNGFKRAELISDSKSEYELNKEIFFVFLIAHTAKHFYTSGTGIRSILDIFIYLRAYEKVIKMEYINDVLKKMELLDFANEMIEISELWFGNGKPRKIFGKTEEYIVSNGTHGNAENEISNRFILRYGNSKFLLIRKVKYFFSTAFPGVEYMSINYPILNRMPLLLPFCWVLRFFSTIIHKRTNIKYRLSGVAKLKKDDIAARPNIKQ